MKVAIYFTHHETLGHTTRIINILNSIKKQIKDDIEILIINGGKKQEFLELEKYGRVIYLPCPIGNEFFDKRKFSDKIREKNKSLIDILRIRIDLIKNSLNELKPDIFITERFPFSSIGWSVELFPIIKFVKKNLNTKLVASIGYPSYSKKTKELLPYYDAILFHCTEMDFEIFNTLLKESYEFQNLIKDFSKKIFFTGYVINKSKLNQLKPKNEIKEKFNIYDKKLIVVSRGGRVEYPRIITCSLKSAKKINDAYFIISTGPPTDNKYQEMYEKIANKIGNIKVVKYLPNFENYLNAADLSINMSGYNTCTELMYLRKQSISIPANDREQMYRAIMLQKLNLTKVIDYVSLSYDNLKNNILNLLENPLIPSEKINKINFDGAENTTKIINELLHE